jgi:hypothetical protein
LVLHDNDLDPHRLAKSYNNKSNTLQNHKQDHMSQTRCNRSFEPDATVTTNTSDRSFKNMAHAVFVFVFSFEVKAKYVMSNTTTNMNLFW